jgi:ribosomal protein S24E
MENYKLINKIKNELFERLEVVATVEAKITPNHEEVEALISKEFKTAVENIKLKGIKGRFGSHTFTITANIYNSEREKNALELKKKWETERVKKLVEAEKAKVEEEKKAKEEAVAKAEEEKKAKESEIAKPEEEPKDEATEEVKSEVKVEEAPKENKE